MSLKLFITQYSLLCPQHLFLELHRIAKYFHKYFGRTISDKWRCRFQCSGAWHCVICRGIPTTWYWRKALRPFETLGNTKWNNADKQERFPCSGTAVETSDLDHWAFVM